MLSKRCLDFKSSNEHKHSQHTFLFLFHITLVVQTASTLINNQYQEFFTGTEHIPDEDAVVALTYVFSLIGSVALCQSKSLVTALE